MPKILIAADYLSSRLFPGTPSAVTVIGAAFDPAQNVLELDITGDCVPRVQAVTATITIEQAKTTFAKVG